MRMRCGWSFDPKIARTVKNAVVQRFSGCLTRIHLKFWCMHIDKRVRSLCLHHSHVGVLPVSMHDIDLMVK